MVEVDELVLALELVQTGQDQYRATNVRHGAHVVRGGQLLAQSVAAALKGQAAAMHVRSIHTVFARAAQFENPLAIAVELVRHDPTGATSCVTIRQGAQICARSLVVLGTTEAAGIDAFGSSCQEVPSPPTASYDRSNGSWDQVVVGDVDVRDVSTVGPPELYVWSRLRGAPSAPSLNQALIAFMTDGFLIGAAMRPHRGVGQAQAHSTLSTGVLSHTLSFHCPGTAGEWLLIAQRSSYAGRGRSFGHGEVCRADGRVVASFVQDAMIRKRVGSPGAL